MLNVRLDSELEKKLKKYSQEKGLSKSSIVKEALARYFSKKEMESSPFALGKDLFGLEGNDDADSSVEYKSRLKEKLREKHAH